MNRLIEILREGAYSCVVRNGGVTRTFTRRGVADIYLLLTREPDFLRGASVADKIVGKAGAALMALGGVAELHAEVVSTPALDVLRRAGVAVSFGVETAAICNRAGTGACPLEVICAAESAPQAMFPLIEDFVKDKITI